MTPLHDHLAAHRDRMIEELTGRLRLRSVAGLPEHDPDLIRSANWLAAALREVGFPAVEVWGTGGGPAVYAEWCARLAATGRDARRSTLRRPALPPCPAGSRPSRTRRG